jgi:hypothetical protein|tara:strand:+ start:99 stop:296 length:198 start_codon:yes stop_codon:yes gene_type:complete
MTLKIYQNKTNQIILKFEITNEILNNYDININNENFQELFETEILNDIFEENNINSSNVYYELSK